MADFDRRELVSELHARPFLAMESKRRVACLFYKESLQESFEGIGKVCEHYQKAPPKKHQNFYMIETRDVLIKWERHTEFSSYMIYASHNGATAAFGEEIFGNLPSGWREAREERLLTSLLIEISEFMPKTSAFEVEIERWRDAFAQESFASARVLDDAALVASDFRLDTNDHVRFLLLPREGTGNKRIGRIVQRIIEIETYKTASMLSLPIARKTNHDLASYERELSGLMIELTDDRENLQKLLDEIINLSAKTEAKLTETAYRFSAAAAYSEIVRDRVKILREERVAGLQLLSEFMLRRYEPSMRTVASTWERLREFSKRVERAANLLRTRVDVRDARLQQELLESMNARAETALRLQETVEGFSVVAIGYYAISLLSYLVAPIAKAQGIDKGWVIALAVIPVILLVRMSVRRVKNHIVSK